MNIWQFMSQSPWLTFFLAWMLIEVTGKCWGRLMRHLNVRRAGWPPSHLDADGDWKPEPKREEE